MIIDHTWLLALATLACAPARIPVHVGSTQANLLLPLYGVVAVAALALAWQLYGEDVRDRELGPLSWPLALLVGWSGISILWTKDVRQGAIELLFFILPFGLLTPASWVAMAAQRYLHTHGLTPEAFGHVALVDRKYAATNPASRMAAASRTKSSFVVDGSIASIVVFSICS